MIETQNTCEVFDILSTSRKQAVSNVMAVSSLITQLYVNLRWKKKYRKSILIGEISLIIAVYLDTISVLNTILCLLNNI